MVVSVGVVVVAGVVVVGGVVPPRDHAALLEAGVAAVYPPGYQSWVTVTELAKPLCGRSRPVHFRGVATVVTKLLTAAKPHVAVFGQKDAQQCLVIRRLVIDLGLDTDLLFVPTLTAGVSDMLAATGTPAKVGYMTVPTPGLPNSICMPVISPANSPISTNSASLSKGRIAATMSSCRG